MKKVLLLFMAGSLLFAVVGCKKDIQQEKIGSGDTRTTQTIMKANHEMSNKQYDFNIKEHPEGLYDIVGSSYSRMHYRISHEKMSFMKITNLNDFPNSSLDLIIDPDRKTIAFDILQNEQANTVYWDLISELPNDYEVVEKVGYIVSCKVWHDRVPNFTDNSYYVIGKYKNSTSDQEEVIPVPVSELDYNDAEIGDIVTISLS